MDDATHRLHSRIRITRLFTLACYAGLLAEFALLNIFRPQGSWSLWLVQTVPLLLVLPGILANRHRSYSWLCFVLLIYFIAYVVNVMSPLYTWPDSLALTLTVIMFITAMMSSRWLQRYQQHCPRPWKAADTGDANNAKG